MMDRFDTGLIGDDPAGDPEQNDETWMISYLDVLTLIIAFFVLVMALTQPQQVVDEAPVEQGRTTGGNTLVEGQGLELLDGEGGLDAPEGDGNSVGGAAGATRAADTRMADMLDALREQGVEVIAGRENITLRLPEGLLFDSGAAELNADGLLLLDELREFLLLFRGQVSVEGHTDNQPIRTRRFASNWELSTSRALAVVSFLADSDVPEERLRAVGYAATRPLETNTTASGRAANRRVELLLSDP